MASATKTGFLPAPSGYVVNFDSPQRIGLPAGYWIGGVGLALSTLFIAMRLFTRLYVVKDFKPEDWCITFSYIIGIPTQAIIFYTRTSGIAAVHGWEITTDQFNLLNTLVAASAVLYMVVSSLAKLSLFLFYHRMSQFRWLRTISVMAILIMAAYTLAVCFALIFACNPVAKGWDIRITEGNCINRGALYITIAAVNTFSDVVVIVLPIPMVFRLQMPMIQKVGVSIIFLIGSLTVITSVVRLKLLLPTLTNPDLPWVVTPPSTWVQVEANLLIICACLPSIRLFIRYFSPKWLGEYSFNGRTRSNGYNESNPNQPLSKLDRRRTHSAYGRMDGTDSEVELQGRQNSQPWQDFKVPAVEKREDVSHLDDITPPSTAHDPERAMPRDGVIAHAY